MHASFFLLWTFLRDPEKARRMPLDIVGLLLLISGVGSLQYILSEGERYDWFADRNIAICAAIAVLGIGSLIAWELRAGVARALVVGAANLGTNYILP